jgi:hypothetical protein
VSSGRRSRGSSAALAFGIAVLLAMGGLVIAALAVSAVVSIFGNFTLFPNK